MADAATASETTALPSNLTPPLQESDSKTSLPPTQSGLSSATNAPFSNPSPSLPLPPSNLTTPPPLLQPSFRPAGSPVPVPSAAITPLFTPLPAYQTPGVPPPGVNPILPLTMASVPEPGSGAPNPVPIASVQQLVAPPYPLAAQHMRYPLPMQSTYTSVPQHFPQGAVLPPGIVRYPSPYAPIIRPAFPPRPLVGVMPPLARPLIGVRGPIIPHIVRPPAIPIVIPTEKPQTTVYVGKISSTVENDFILSLLQLCGPVKSWKRAQDPTNGTLKGFGFCEFEFAEGVLRALRLLNKLSVDGLELMLNVNQATRTYLERYLMKKKNESSKNSQETETEGSNKEESTPPGSVKEMEKSEESLKLSLDEEKKEGEKLNTPESTNFGIVTDEDVEADREILEKLTFMIEERLKNKPLPPPPSQTAVDGPGNLNSEQRSGSRDRDSDINVAKDDSDDKNEDEKAAESKLSNDHDRAETSSPDRSRRHESSRDRDRESRRDKERELERYEKEREQERAKREKDREYKSREEERRYKIREKDWETREREREHWRKREREKEKDRHQERKWEVMDQEHDSDDGYGKKRKYRTSDEERKRRQREKDEDLADRMREEEEIVEMRLRAEEELHRKQQEALKTISGERANGHERATLPNETYFEDDKGVDQISDLLPKQEIYEGILQNGKSDETVNAASDERLISNAPTRKLGFGLSGSGKRASVPSVFNEDEDEDEHKEKKMRPLVPIDYSTEEHQTGQSLILEGPPANMVAAADYVKHVSAFNSKEEKLNLEKEKDRRYSEKAGQRDRGRHEEGINNTREENRKDNLDRERANKLRTPENQKLLDAKQLIDTIPKTKDELFSYQINWVIYKQNALHERMRPWISKKITDFLGEEEVTLVDYIVSSTQEHISADDMLERLQAILDDEAEMFVLKMWRMLIFEIKKVETGLAPKAKN